MKVIIPICVSLIFSFYAIPLSTKAQTNQADNHSLQRKISWYERAEKEEEKRRNELHIIKDIGRDTYSKSYRSNGLTYTFGSAKESVEQRNNVLQKLFVKANEAFIQREKALDGLNNFSEATEVAIKTIRSYATSNSSEVTSDVNFADKAVEQKSHFKNTSKIRYKQAVKSLKELDKLNQNILRDNRRYTRLLSSLRKECEELFKLQKSIDQRIVENKSIFPLKIYRLLEGKDRFNVNIIGKIDTLDSKNKALFDEINEELRNVAEYESRSAEMVEDLFRTTLSAAVVRDSQFYLQITKDESLIDTVSQNLRTLQVRIKALRKETLRSIEKTRSSVSFISNVFDGVNDPSSGLEEMLDIEQGLLALKNDSKNLNNRLKTAIKVKSNQYKVAKEKADQAYLLAYGKPRNREKQRNSLDYASATASDGSLQAYTKEMASSISINSHLYTRISLFDNEPSGYGAYTYVLFSQNYNSAQEHIKARYSAILEAIYRSTTSIENFSAPVLPENLNLFCIPCKNRAGETSRCDQYDSDLSRSYLVTAGSGAILRPNVIKIIRRSPGPFLLTTRNKLSEGKTESHLLFVDLSKFQAENFDAIISEYKNSVVEHPPTGQEIWSPSATNRILYAGISLSTAIPELVNKIKTIYGFVRPKKTAKPAGSS